ncbi:MAG: hypothetical protein KAI47_26125 [Deltaproteobacteria bacterium]|nr:hypothetical protein [Deltaproteobacteria bacterium]
MEGLNDVEPKLLVEDEALRPEDLAGVGAVASEAREPLALAVEDLDPSVLVIGDIDAIVSGVAVYSRGKREGGLAGGGPPEGSSLLSRGRKDDHLIGFAVDDVELIVVAVVGQLVGHAEGAGLSSEGSEAFAQGVEDEHGACRVVTDIDAAGLVDGAAEGTLNAGDRAFPRALGRKDMHRAPEGVGDDDVSVWGDGDAAR